MIPAWWVDVAAHTLLLALASGFFGYGLVRAYDAGEWGQMRRRVSSVRRWLCDVRLAVRAWLHDVSPVTARTARAAAIDSYVQGWNEGNTQGRKSAEEALRLRAQMQIRRQA